MTKVLILAMLLLYLSSCKCGDSSRWRFSNVGKLGNNLDFLFTSTLEGRSFLLRNCSHKLIILTECNWYEVKYETKDSKNPVINPAPAIINFTKITQDWRTPPNKCIGVLNKFIKEAESLIIQNVYSILITSFIRCYDFGLVSSTIRFGYNKRVHWMGTQSRSCLRTKEYMVYLICIIKNLNNRRSKSSKDKYTFRSVIAKFQVIIQIFKKNRSSRS